MGQMIILVGMKATIMVNMFFLQAMTLRKPMMIFLKARILMGHKMILVRMNEIIMVKTIFLQAMILMPPMMILLQASILKRDDDSGENEPSSGEDTNIVDYVDLTSSDKHDSDEDNHYPTKFRDDNVNARDDIPHSDDDTHLNEDDAMVHEKQRQIVLMRKIICRTIPYYINPSHSSYTRLV